MDNLEQRALPVHCPDTMFLVRRQMVSQIFPREEEVNFYCTLNFLRVCAARGPDLPIKILMSLRQAG